MIGDGTVDLDLDLVSILAGIEARRAFVTSLVRAGTDASDKVVGLSWTVVELGAHLAATADNYCLMAEGQAVVTATVSERRTVIDDGIEKHVRSTAAEQADTVGAGLDRLVVALGNRCDDDRLPYYGMDVSPAVVAGMFLSELLVHGVDLARTHNRRLEVPDRAAYDALLAGSALAPLIVTAWGRSRAMVLGYDVRGHAPILVALDRGRVTINHRRDGPVDAWFGGSAADLLLTSYHRVGAMRSLRTMRLRGRRPYLALTADRAFEPA